MFCHAFCRCIRLRDLFISVFLRELDGQSQVLKFKQSQDRGYSIPTENSAGDLRPRDQHIRHDSLTNVVDSLEHNLSKRAVTSEIWSNYVCKGEKLLALMAMRIDEATNTLGFPSESVFQDYDDLERNSWQAYDKSAYYEFSNLNIDNIFQELGFDATSGSPLNPEVKNKVVAWVQDEQYNVDGKEYNVCMPKPKFVLENFETNDSYIIAFRCPIY